MVGYFNIIVVYPQTNNIVKYGIDESQVWSIAALSMKSRQNVGITCSKFDDLKWTWFDELGLMTLR